MERENDSRSSSTEIQILLTRSRKASVKNMWIVCLSMTFCVFVDLIYSLGVYACTDADCNPSYLSMPFYSLFKFIDRFFMYYAWVYPLIYVFWPSAKGLKEEEDHRNSVKTLRESEYGPTSSILSDSQEQDRKPSTGFLKRDGEPTPVIFSHDYIHALSTQHRSDEPDSFGALLGSVGDNLERSGGSEKRFTNISTASIDIDKLLRK